MIGTRPCRLGGGARVVKCIEGTVNDFTNPAFNYYAKGNMTAGLGRTLTYTSYNMPAQVEDDAGFIGGDVYGKEIESNSFLEKMPSRLELNNP